MNEIISDLRNLISALFKFTGNVPVLINSYHIKNDRLPNFVERKYKPF